MEVKKLRCPQDLRLPPLRVRTSGVLPSFSATNRYFTPFFYTNKYFYTIFMVIAMWCFICLSPYYYTHALSDVVTPYIYGYCCDVLFTELQISIIAQLNLCLRFFGYNPSEPMYSSLAHLGSCTIFLEGLLPRIAARCWGHTLLCVTTVFSVASRASVSDADEALASAILQTKKINFV